MEKSLAFTTLLSSASPAFIRPISVLVVSPGAGNTLPEFARYCGPFTLQLYAPPTGELTVTVKKPEASVVMPVYSIAAPPAAGRNVMLIGSDCFGSGCAGRPCQVTCPT